MNLVQNSFHPTQDDAVKGPVPANDFQGPVKSIVDHIE